MLAAVRVRMEVAVTEQAQEDLAGVPRHVEETFRSRVAAVETNLQIGADPGQAFDKYLSGGMHPVLQMNLGRDYRAWFIEGVYVEEADEEMIYCWRILSKNQAKKLSSSITDPVDAVRYSLE